MDTTATVKRRRRREELTDAKVAELRRKADPYFEPDTEQRKFGVRVYPNGPPHAFYVICRDPYGKQQWRKLGATDQMTIAEARAGARVMIDRIEKGLPAKEPPPPKKDSVADVTENWYQRHILKTGVRTAPEIRRILDKYILPTWADREFATLRRSDYAALLDHIEDKHSAPVADTVLAVLRNAASWHATRDDEYTPPLVKGMRRTPKHKRRRDVALNDDQLRAVWRAATDAGVYGAFIKILLLTAQRRETVLQMKWPHLDGDIWSIPEEERAKGTGGDLKLPKLALDIITKLPKFVGNPFVFASRGGKPISGLAHRKTALDKASGVKGWRAHDLRRSARSLMSRAGVLSEHAEKVLGHAVPGVGGIYDVHSYLEEKGHALAKLAALIETIVNPPADNVDTTLDKRRRRS